MFRCTDDWENDLVAKILIPRNRTYEAVRNGWLKELGNLVKLRHPNITFVYDAFEYRDTFYIIMERCEQTFHKSMIRDKMEPRKALVVVFKIGDLGTTNLELEIDVFNTMVGKWMLPPEFLKPDKYGAIGRQVDIYHAGLLFLSLLLRHVPAFTPEEILDGMPRRSAEGLDSASAPAIARALRRHVDSRTQTAIDFRKDISALHNQRIMLHQLVKKVLIHSRDNTEVWYCLPNPQRFANCNIWLPICASMRSRPGPVEPDPYFRIMHSAQVGRKNGSVTTYRKQTAEVAVESWNVQERTGGQCDTA